VKKIFLVLLLAFLFNGNAYADLMMGRYIENRSSNNKEVHEVMDISIKLIEEGIAIANVELGYTKRKKLYCQPETLAFNSENIASFLEYQIQKFKDKGRSIDKFPVSMVLMKHLKETFPCK
tara:strand:+ start:114 stop:476 length:363 start_codon:yes stop_codon:yes gene_type:complete